MNSKGENHMMFRASDTKAHRSEKPTTPFIVRIARRAAIIALLLVPLGANSAESMADQPFTIEYYYKVKLGFFDEWIDLYKKNHWPVMMAEMEEGHVLDIKVDRARAYLPESHRWDLRVTITFKNVLVPHGLVERNRDSTIARLFPDRDLFEEEEQRRFQLLEGLMEVELLSVPTDDW